MENYNIYDEIGRGTHSFVYKARRKRSIEYVAVKSTAKSRMDKILNEVPFLHKLDSPYVLRFFDWYESSNHIWLILEYCMGGDLLNLITQDKQLPEDTVKSFGLELVAGLQYLHANSILYCDLKPANVLIDEFGSLKLADFGLARRIPGSDETPTRPLAPGSPHYMAPELFQQPTVHSFASDFWALGCVLYELRTGRQPFIHTNFSELARMIQTKPVELPVPGCEMSPVFCNLLERLLMKDPYQRIIWDELVDHPFWDNLPRLGKIMMPAQEIFDRDSRVPEQNGAISRDFSNNAEDPRNDSQETHDDHDENVYVGNDVVSDVATNGERVPRLNGVEVPSTEDRRENGAMLDFGDFESANTSTATSAETSVIHHASPDEVRPVSAPNQRGRLLSNNNAESDDDTQDDIFIKPPGIRHRWRTENAPHSAPPALLHTPKQRVQLSSLFDRSGAPGNGLRKISKLIFTAADCRVKSIIGNKDIKFSELPRVQANLHRFTLMAPDRLLSCTTEVLENQLKEIYISLKSSHTAVQEKLSVMAYLFSLSCHARLAHVIVNSSILKILIRILAQESPSTTSNKTVVSMVCLILGVLFRFATIIAPSSPDQLRLLVKILLEIVDGSTIEVEDNETTNRDGLQPRPLALACLGELLFYISTQQEWELPVEGVEAVLACIDDSNFAMRYYGVRTLGNMLIHSAEALLPRLMSEKIVLTLIRGLLQYATPKSGKDLDGQNVIIALRTTTTEALAHVLRHLRIPLSVAKLPPRLRRSIILLFAKPDILNAVWLGVYNTGGSTDLAIASLNILNAFLDMKLDVDRETECSAIKASRTLLLERIVTFLTIQKILEIDRTTVGGEVDEDSITILQAKSLIMLHLGVQSDRMFLLSFVQTDSLSLVEKVMGSIADKVSSDEINRGSVSPEKKLSAFELYLAQCALNMCKLSIRMALKLGADCFSSFEAGDDENNNAGHRPPRISPIPFQLFGELLRHSNCRQQLLIYFIANDSKQYTFFLRLMAKLLTSFPEEVLIVPEDSAIKMTIAGYVSEMLLELFGFAASEANEIVLVEKQVLFTLLLPAIVKNICGGAEKYREIVATKCLQILHVVLLDFDYEDDNGDYEFYDPFIRSVLLPHLNSMLARREVMLEKIWSLSSELLFGLLSSDSSLLAESKDLKVISTALILFHTPSDFQALPSHAIQLVQMFLDSADIDEDALFEAGISNSIVAGLMFTSKRMTTNGNLMDLTVILLNLLHQQFERIRQLGIAPTPAGFDELLCCGPLMLQLCSRVNIEPQAENDATEANETLENARKDAELADFASRCLVLLSQVKCCWITKTIVLHANQYNCEDIRRTVERGDV
ncbi:ULK/ULK protein Kinase [Phytophthora palmivora]|uniref:ULK/ULK protein Kinase n=1 Tax=Phytophthora palmivora TaxID=4796 RepID=A0A2P4WZ25_9STRA|nr:ULK/ULK protein Kinase [Phytophthora palmivora]